MLYRVQHFDIRFKTVRDSGWIKPVMEIFKTLSFLHSIGFCLMVIQQLFFLLKFAWGNFLIFYLLDFFLIIKVLILIHCNQVNSTDKYKYKGNIIYLLNPKPLPTDVYFSMFLLSLHCFIQTYIFSSIYHPQLWEFCSGSLCEQDVGFLKIIIIIIITYI